MTQLLELHTSEGTEPARMVLKTLKLRNFKRHKDFTLEAQGDVSVYGRNRLGKTTIADAISWLLFGKDSLGKEKFDIKTIGEDGKPLRMLEHEVEATFLVSGRETTLRKVHKEVWKRSRGSTEKEFDGHTNEYEIDGVPHTEAQYKAFIQNLCKEQLFRLLADPDHFPAKMHWKERRALLLEVCGDVSDFDVIEANPKLGDLSQILSGRSIEDHKAVAEAQKKKINEEIKSIPDRIDECRRSISQIEAAETPAESREELESRRQALLEQAARIESGGEAAERRRQIAELDAQILAIKNKQTQELGARLQEQQKALQQVRNEHDAARRKVQQSSYDIEQLEVRIARDTARLDQLRAEHNALKAQEFAGSVPGACAACGQDLPEGQVEAARAKAEADFNLAKSNKLEANLSEGRPLKAAIEQNKAKLEELIAARERAEAEETRLAEAARAEQARLESSPVSPTPSEHDPELKSLISQREAIAASLTALAEESQTELAGIRRQIEQVDALLRRLDEAAAAAKEKARAEGRIEELRAREKELAAQYEERQREIFLIEEFTRAKARMLTEKINSKFSITTFKLFDELVGGGAVECCEPTIDGRPYATALSNSERINVGLDIINTLSIHYKFAPMVVIDNAEAVNDFIPTAGQQIRLIVSNDPTLRIELAS